MIVSPDAPTTDDTPARTPDADETTLTRDDQTPTDAKADQEQPPVLRALDRLFATLSDGWEQLQEALVEVLPTTETDEGSGVPASSIEAAPVSAEGSTATADVSEATSSSSAPTTANGESGRADDELFRAALVGSVSLATAAAFSTAAGAAFGGIGASPALFTSDTALPEALATEAADRSQAVAALGQLPLRFEQNVGQFSTTVDYVVRGAGYEAGLSATGATYIVSGVAPETGEAVRVGVHMSVVGANPDAVGSGQGLLSGRTNYLVGNDPSQHFRNVTSYASVTYQEVYSGIDLVYRSSPTRQMQHDFVVAPGANPDAIALRFDGAEQVALDAGGNLLLQTAAGTIEQAKPFTYQIVDGQVREVGSAFAVATDGTVSFIVGAYDPSRELVIDPEWAYATYLGGTDLDRAEGIAVEAGIAWVTGTTESSAFLRGDGQEERAPGKELGAPLFGHLAGGNVFVAKINAQGTDLVYLTYVGGSATDTGRDIAVDEDGAAYITGATNSEDFYMKTAWDNTYGGAIDAFLTKLNFDGTNAVYSTYVGGTGPDLGYSIAIDILVEEGTDPWAYLVGETTGSLPFGNFNPTLLGPRGMKDCFVTRFNATGAMNRLVIMGGNHNDIAWGVTVDTAAVEKIYVTGETARGTGAFPTTVGAFRRTDLGAVDGEIDAFVAKIDPGPEAPTLVYSTLFGGTKEDYGKDLVVDINNGSAYVVGRTRTKAADGFLDENNVKLEPIQLGEGGAAGTTDPDVWVAKFDSTGNPNLQQGKYFAYILGKSWEEGTGIALSGGKVYVVGNTLSDIPTHKFPADPARTKYRGSQDGFLVQLDPSQQGNGGKDSLLFSMYFGGTGMEEARSIAVSGGFAYLAGTTRSGDFRAPVVGPANAFRLKYAGGASDGFAVKVKPDANPRAQLDPINDFFTTVGQLLTFTVSATDPESEPVEYSLYGQPTGAAINPVSGAFSWTPSAGQGAGLYTFLVVASDPWGGLDDQAVNILVSPNGSFLDLAGDELLTAFPVHHLADIESNIPGLIGDGQFPTKDVDLYRVDLLEGHTLVLDVEAFALDDGGTLSNLDSYLRVFDASGVELAFQDDGPDPDTGLPSLDAALTFVAPADGTYYVGVSGWPNMFYDPNTPGSGTPGSAGEYRLQVTVNPLVPPL